MQVSDEVKKAYKGNSVTRHIFVEFPDMPEENADTEKMYYETLKLYESVLESDSLEFVGCIASKLSMQLYGISDNIKGQRVNVSVWTDGTEDEPIQLFSGIVDSAVSAANKKYKEITAYDDLYTKGEMDVAAWYKGLIFPSEMKYIRDSFFEYIGIEQKECTLPNDDIRISRQYELQTLKALDVMKSICQFNGIFGIIGRDGLFDYRLPKSGAADDREDMDKYRSVEYDDFSTKPIGKVIIKRPGEEGTVGDSEDDTDDIYGKSVYIIDNNMFAKGLSDEDIEKAQNAIYENIKDFSYQPFTATNNGMPWIECGVSSVSYEMLKSDSYEEYERKNFFVLSRELTGLQGMKDMYSADGEEYISQFVTNVNAQIGTLKEEYSTLSASKLVTYTYSNPLPYTVGNKEVPVIVITYAANLDTTPIFVATVPFEMESDGNVIFRYYENNVLVEMYTIKKYVPDGNHFVTLSNYFVAKSNTRTVLRVTMQTEYINSSTRQMAADIKALKAYTDTGTYIQMEPDKTSPVAKIAEGTIRAVLYANGLSGSVPWDGTIDVSDYFTPVKIDGIEVSKFNTNTDVKDTTGSTGRIVEAFSAIDISEIGISGFLDNIDAQTNEI